jgi:hypothetical protein
LAVQELDPKEWDQQFEVQQYASEEGSNFVLLISIPGRTKPLTWNLSAMTAEELEATRQFFNHLFDLAEPVVNERDRIARDAFREGDDSYARSYRTPPTFVTRERKKRTNRESVQHGSSDATEGSGAGLDPDGGVRGHSDELADRYEEDGRPEDDDTPHYQP